LDDGGGGGGEQGGGRRLPVIARFQASALSAPPCAGRIADVRLSGGARPAALAPQPHGGSREARRPQIETVLPSSCRSYDGAVSAFTGVEAQAYKSLTALQARHDAVPPRICLPTHRHSHHPCMQALLTRALPHAAGLNPTTWRLYANSAAPVRPRARNVLDVDLLLRFPTLRRQSAGNRGLVL